MSSGPRTRTSTTAYTGAVIFRLFVCVRMDAATPQGGNVPEYHRGDPYPYDEMADESVPFVLLTGPDAAARTTELLRAIREARAELEPPRGEMAIVRARKILSDALGPARPLDPFADRLSR